MDQRTQFIADFLREVLTVTELCDLYGVSRKTGYKWIERYLRQGPAGLEARSRRPRVSPNATPDETVQAFLAVRRRHPAWGAKKLLAIVHQRRPRLGSAGALHRLRYLEPSRDETVKGDRKRGLTPLFCCASRISMAD
jgi:hypothetical protein